MACSLLRRMDKICHSDKPHCTVASGACDLYWNPMLCERLAGRTGILLNENRQLKIRAACFGLLVISNESSASTHICKSPSR